MLARYRPQGVFLGPIGDVQDELGRFLGDVWGEARGAFVGYRMDVREDDTHVYVEAELPGLKKEDIDITLEKGVLTIRGEKKQEREECDEHYHLRERRYGTFQRSVALPSVVDDSAVTAELRDGILHVTLDKREEVRPRHIEVK